MKVAIPLVGPSYQSRELKLSAQVCKNLYPSIDPEAKTITSAHSFPGLKSFATSVNTRDRGLFAANGLLYQVSGQTLYRVSASGGRAVLGSILGSGRCDFANDSNYVVVTTGGVASILALASSTVTAISDEDLTNPTTVGYMNQFFIYDQNAGVSGQFVTSQVSAPFDVSGLDYAESESNPDDILRIIIANQLVYFFGSDTVEPWYNSGTGNPPFDRVQGGVKPYGISGPWAVAQTHNNVYFLDNTRQPCQMVGLDVQPIGNNALGKEWQSYSTVADAEASCFILDQQEFFLLNFPTADRSWCFHKNSGTWFQLSEGVNDAVYRGGSYAYCYGKHFFADRETGAIYEADFQTYTNAEAPMQRVRATSPIHSGLYGTPGLTMWFDQVEFDVQVGQGLPTGQGSNPMMMVRYSDDGGFTWSAEQQYELGVSGDYLRKVVLHDQGSADSRIYELTYTDPTPFALLQASANIQFADHG